MTPSTCMADRLCWKHIFSSLKNYSHPGLMKYYILMTGSDLNCSGPGGIEWAHDDMTLACLLIFLMFAFFWMHEYLSNYFTFWIKAAFDLSMWRDTDMKASLCCHLHWLCLLHGNRFCSVVTSATMTSHFTLLQFIQNGEEACRSNSPAFNWRSSVKWASSIT